MSSLWGLTVHGSDGYNDEKCYGIINANGNFIGWCETEKDALKIINEHNKTVEQLLKGNE